MPVAKDKGSTHKASNITYDINSPVHTHPPSVLPSSVLAGSSSFCARPPILLEFPTFYDSCETAEVLNFVEQCENFLEIRPVPSLELIGTLSPLKGPAQSWWKAEKAKVTDWQSFKKAFMAAFLSDDYLSEVEEKLRTLVQQPRQCLRDFAYDYRALCLKWKPEISEEELVNRILNNINPRVAGCLRGTVNTVEQLVKVGSLVEKDCMGAKDYWQKVSTQGSKEKTKKSAERTNTKNLAGVTLAQPHSVTSLLIVPVRVNGQEVKAVIDTGSSYTLMRENLWKQLKMETSSVIPSTPQRFIMADGTIHQSRDLQKLHYQWHDQECTLDTYILKNTHLAFPLIAGLDFLTATGAVLEVGQGRVPELMSFTSEISQWDSGNQEELLKLITTWPRTTSDILGRTSVVQHKITLTDDIPFKSQAYRVSPIKKQIIEEQVDQMLQDDIIEPSFSPWSSPVVLVPKPDGSYRFCVDYRRLNSKTVPDAYPMPFIHDILESMEGAS
ncbi:Transposon Ty3-I Gag-Pol [Labeo rohita]|uniref:Transposon Ty3-I Gag-Pol n=1 Tax=Labeo rohita TaxID=84645 RepID=A0A498NNC4_LABRO|nr:Transposon Ty3-I Gag-Pol [Labeo rohita]